MPKKPKKAPTATADGTSKRTAAEPKAIQLRALKVGSLRDLRKATKHTQDDLAIAMGVGQGTVSRIEKRSDMLVSTLQHYVEGMGGTLQILATFPNRPALIVERLGKRPTRYTNKNTLKRTAGSNTPAGP